MIVNWNVPYLSETIRDILAEARGAPSMNGYPHRIPELSGETPRPAGP